jgi:tripartite-type tricarboxylate transporter receptor subunit TctC
MKAKSNQLLFFNAFFIFLLCLSFNIFADNFPEKTVKIIVPYPPGGFTDILARVIAEKLSLKINQSVIVDNKGGGGSVIGSNIAAKSAPDGYTLLLVAPDLAINESLIPDKLTYGAVKDFQPVIECALSPLAMVINSKLGVQSYSEFADFVKKHPNEIYFASGGNGTGAHLALELFTINSRLNLVHVPYKGNGPALTDLLGGQVSGMFLPYALAKPYIESNKLVILGTPSGKRSTAIPQIPTLVEQGVTGLDVQPWFGIVVPKGTAQSRVKFLNKNISDIMTSNEVKLKLKDLGAEAVTSSPEDFDSFIREEIKRWAKVIVELNIKAD